MSLTATPTTLTLDTIESYFQRPGGWCVSIYMPTHRAGKEVREAPIRLKNRLSAAEQNLKNAGVEEGEIDQILKPARGLCDFDSESNREFWTHQADGLAILLNDGNEQIYQLQIPVDELTMVAHRFHTKPLLRAVQRDQEYCVLAVSQDQVRFLEGSSRGLHECSLEQLPESLQDVVGGEHHKGFNLHSFRTRAAEGENAVPHGHVESDQEHELRQYFRTIHEALDDALRSDDRPLVFAGVAELFPYFRDAMDYEHVVGEPVTGNPDSLSTDELHDKAWPLVAKKFTQQEQQTLDGWNAAAHTDLAEDSIASILDAAHDGRIDTLILRAGDQCWGEYDVDTRSTQRAETATADNYDLLDLAAVKTLQADGNVKILSDETLPDDFHAGAICQFAL